MILQQYGDDLRKDFAAKVCQVPNRDEKPKEQVVTKPIAPKENQAKKEINKIVVDQKETGAKIKTKKLILKETFMCSCEDFYNVSSLENLSAVIVDIFKQFKTI